jgi:hypothetical protein
VRTAPHLVAFRDWMRERIDAAPHVRFVNATPGGILHHPRIETAALPDVARSFPLLDAETPGAFEAQIRARHRPAADGTSRLLEAAQRLVDAPFSEAGGDPRSEWLAFAAGRIGPDAIAAALQSRELAAWSLGHTRALSALASPAGR